LLVLFFLIGATFFSLFFSQKASADCSVPGCLKPLGSSVCTDKNDWTGCVHITGGFPHYEYQELSGNPCTCGGGWPVGTECVWGWQQWWEEECGGCCWDSSVGPCDCGVCIPCGCGVVALGPENQYFAENNQQEFSLANNSINDSEGLAKESVQESFFAGNLIASIFSWTEKALEVFFSWIEKILPK